MPTESTRSCLALFADVNHSQSKMGDFLPYLLNMIKRLFKYFTSLLRGTFWKKILFLPKACKSYYERPERYVFENMGRSVGW